MGESADAVTPGASTFRLREGFHAQYALLSWMQDVAPYGLLITDTDLRVRSWNHWLCAASGISADEIVGKRLTEVFPELAARHLDRYYERALQGEVSVLSTALHKYLLPFPAAHRRGRFTRMLQTARIAPLPSAQGISGTITTIEDVTEREYQSSSLYRQQEHDRILSRALSCLLTSGDPLKDIGALFPELGPSLGVETFVNHRFNDTAGVLELESASGVPPRHREQMSTIQIGQRLCGQCALQRQPIIVSNLQTSANAHVEAHRSLGLRFFCCFPLLITDRLLGTVGFGSYSEDTLLPDELALLARLAQYIGIAMERTQREKELRAAQGELREHAENLETIVTERTARLHETIAQLESFSYTVAHDLRAPIRALKGYCEVLSEDFSGGVSTEGKMILGRLQRASDRLDALTRDLLEFSKIGRREVRLEPVDLDELVDELLHVSPTLERIVQVHRRLGKVRAQRTLLQQCLSNLLDNALKFRAPDVEVQISIRTEMREHSNEALRTGTATPLIPATISLMAPRADGSPASFLESAAGPRVRIWVDDNGLGIPPAAHEKIFGIFERGTGVDNIQGTGIGLAIVARAVQQMGGTCGVESTVGQGSHFWIDLAVAE
jgi:PAS domain S-box-containing protein